MIVTELYDGEIELVFDEAKHRYLVDGKYVPGVTTALGVINKPALIPWAVNKATKYIEDRITPGVALDEVEIDSMLRKAKWAHKDFTDEAATMGTKVHQYIESSMRGFAPMMPTNTKMRRAIKQFHEFWDEADIEVIDIEKPVYSREYGYAGTYDLKCKLNGKLTVLDWKTGSGIYDTHILQGGAYAQADAEETGDEIEQIAVVNCSVKAPFRVYTTTKVNEAIEGYNTAYRLGQLMKNVREDLERNK